MAEYDALMDRLKLVEVTTERDYFMAQTKLLRHEVERLQNMNGKASLEFGRALIEIDRLKVENHRLQVEEGNFATQERNAVHQELSAAWAQEVKELEKVISVQKEEIDRLREVIGECCQCRWDVVDGQRQQVEECHLHACERHVCMENGDPSDVTLLEQIDRLKAENHRLKADLRMAAERHAKDYRSIESLLRDVSSRFGSAALPGWCRSRIEEIANLIGSWARATAQPELLQGCAEQQRVEAIHQQDRED